MFLTACAPNLLGVELIAKLLHVQITWMDWLKGFAPIGVSLFVVTPFLLYKIYPPEIKESPDAPRWAAEELRMMGSITAREIKLLVLMLAALAMWIGAGKTIEPSLTAVLVVVLMVTLNVVTWNDVLENVLRDFSSFTHVLVKGRAGHEQLHYSHRLCRGRQRKPSRAQC